MIRKTKWSSTYSGSSDAAEILIALNGLPRRQSWETILFSTPLNREWNI